MMLVLELEGDPPAGVMLVVGTMRTLEIKNRGAAKLGFSAASIARMSVAIERSGPPYVACRTEEDAAATASTVKLSVALE
jgi:hypothetical protein